MLEERRQHPRWVPSAPMFVSLDASKSGLLLDVCAGGIAVASLIPRNLQDVIALEFELPEGCGRVSANAEIAWTRDNGHLSGARFVNLDDDSRAQLSRWIEDMASAPSLESRCEEPVIVATEVLEPEVAGSGVVEPELAAPEFTKIEEQASLFHVQAVENRPKAAADTHPVDSYFLDASQEEHRSEETLLITDEVRSPVEELDALTESETTETIHDSSTEFPADVSSELGQTGAPIATTAPAETIVADAAAMDMVAESAAIEIAPETTTTQEESIAEEEAPVFVTRSSYMQSERVTQEEDEARMHLERAAVFVGEAKTEDVASEPAKDWLMRPWNIPRTAGLQILTEPGATSTSQKSRHTIELILTVVVLSWALVFLGYQMGSTGVSRESPKVMDATSVGARATEDLSKGLVPSVEASPALPEMRSPSSGNAANRREPASRPVAKAEAGSASMLGDPGLVLQVGAMKREDNADALARELQKKNMPAFVFRHGPDRLYRVAVGPFSNEQATDKAKGSLEKQGLKPILRRWLPQ